MNNVIITDTDYAPKNSTDEFRGFEGGQKIMFVRVFPESGDPFINIVADNEYMRECCDKVGAIIVGTGVIEDTSIGELMYGLQHPTRTLYRDAMSTFNEIYKKALENKFTADDAELRKQFNQILDNYDKEDNKNGSEN